MPVSAERQSASGGCRREYHRARQNHADTAFTGVHCHRMEQEVHRAIAVSSLRIADQFTEAPGSQRQMVCWVPDIRTARLEALTLTGDKHRHLPRESCAGFFKNREQRDGIGLHGGLVPGDRSTSSCCCFPYQIDSRLSAQMCSCPPACRSPSLSPMSFLTEGGPRPCYGFTGTCEAPDYENKDRRNQLRPSKSAYARPVRPATASAPRQRPHRAWPNLRSDARFRVPFRQANPSPLRCRWYNLIPSPKVFLAIDGGRSGDHGQDRVRALRPPLPLCQWLEILARALPRW
jgi:hypothetical protein